MNNSIISGNVGKDPELRTTPKGTKVATYSVGSTTQNPNDKDKSLTDWYNVVAWGFQAEEVMANVKKGSKVLVIGKFKTRNYDDKDGKKIYVTELMQNELWLAPKKEDTSTTVDDSDLPW